MSDEEKKPVIDDVKDPITNVEETVSDLKKKIEELNEENEKKAEEETPAGKINDLKEAAKDTLEKGIQDMMNEADKKLYDGKRSGKNQVVF